MRFCSISLKSHFGSVSTSVIHLACILHCVFRQPVTKKYLQRLCVLNPRRPLLNHQRQFNARYRVVCAARVSFTSGYAAKAIMHTSLSAVLDRCVRGCVRRGVEHYRRSFVHLRENCGGWIWVRRLSMDLILYCSARPWDCPISRCTKRSYPPAEDLHRWTLPEACP